MKAQNPHTSSSYGSVSQCLHWLTVFLIFVQIAMGFGFDLLPGAWKESASALHQSLGMATLLVIAFRIFWRLSAVQPQPLAMPKLQQIAAGLTHFALYALCLAMPVCGWLTVSAFGRDTPFFGILSFPPLIEKDRMTAIFLREAHEAGAWILCGLIVLHVGAALYHHIIVKDGILRRMLPTKK